jgi:hypothetical protein
MSGFLGEQGGTRICGEAYMGYVAAENPRTTPLTEKGAIYGRTAQGIGCLQWATRQLVRTAERDLVHACHETFQERQ